MQGMPDGCMIPRPFHQRTIIFISHVLYEEIMKEGSIEFEPQILPDPNSDESFSLANFPSGSTDWNFYASQDGVIVANYVHDGHLYMAVSYDCGKTFSDAMKLMLIENEMKKFDILVKGDQFVISVLEINKETEHQVKKAVSGWLTRETNSFTHKECVRFSPELGETIINVSLGFRKSSTVQNAIESVDHVFTKRENIVSIKIQGHPCVVKT